MSRLRIAIVTVILASAAAAYASIVCPIHTYAPCYFTGETRMGAQRWKCTCGDSVWVRP